MAGKPLPFAATAACSIQRSLLAVAALTLICFSLLSLRSLRSSPQFPSPEVAVAEVSSDLSSRMLLPSSIYHSPDVFLKNYAEMERRFRVFIYRDGDPNTYFQTPRKLTGKYSSEGYFFQNIRESRFRTEDADQADLFFVPISCHKMRGKGISYENMTIIVQNYVESNHGCRSLFVTCHDVGVRAFEGLQMVVKNSIRVVCSPSYDVGYIPHKDIALPQVLQPFALPSGGNDYIPHKDIALPQVLQPFALPSGGNDIENRTILGFWAGHRNSKIRVILARVWENDTELAISNNRISRATGELVYQKQFYRTKFCICPGGSQVNSARIADSIHYGCIPVIMSNYYDLPFNDILDWQKFSVILKESDIYQLKSILKSIPHEKFVELHEHLVEVQKHFEWHSPPIPYDAFHMVMYELWLRHHVIKY
ncbi:hypothetical protein C4D60_Mb06t21200 [Musa balbisiana]|uniref:Exostosin GT47 domain-containing protein n=1 Tax=Musa balbisiana TaxID=52838 RepID=A0A4S8IPN1_MUSBA|nr:hypothetical protein C4D60_Mb06t21200 [Musa balbisiana]